MRYCAVLGVAVVAYQATTTSEFLEQGMIVAKQHKLAQLVTNSHVKFELDEVERL
jgi:hypothetical protein